MKQYLVNEETMNLILSTLNKAPYQDTIAVVKNINQNVKLIRSATIEESTTTESNGENTDVGQQS